MSRKLFLSLLVLAVASAAYLAGSLQAPRQTVVAAGTVAPRTILHYHCPMHPNFKSDHPGTAPCCGMALEPVYADAASPMTKTEPLPAGTIAVSSVQQQLIGVKVAAVERAGGTERVRAFGRVTPDETRIHKLNVGIDAYIRDVPNVTTGSYVKKNQWLASFASADARPPVTAFIATLDILDREQKNGGGNPATVTAAKTSLSLAVDRLLTLGMSPEQIEEIRQTRQPTSVYKVLSPVDGFILARNVSAGQKIAPGDELFQVCDLQRVWILADVPVTEADAVKPGTLARVRVGGRETPVRARVSGSVLPQFDPTTQSFKLRLEADNPGFVLRSDMFVDVEFDVAYEPTVLVPADAVMVSGVRNHVFVERSAGVFEAREVQTGRRHGTRIAVVKGLDPGERIAISGTFLLDSESRMKSHDRPTH